MKLKLYLGICVFAQFLFACSPSFDSNFKEHDRFHFDSFLKKNFLEIKKEKALNGVWFNQWKNRDGYPVYEFITVKPNQASTCVINAMGGYEYSPAVLSNQTLTTHFIDPSKETYVNQLREFGHKSQEVELLYSLESDQFHWKNAVSTKNHPYTYTRLNSAQAKNWNLYQEICGQLVDQAKKINLNDVTIKKNTYLHSSNVIGLLQLSKSRSNEGNYCVYNQDNKTISSLPVSVDSEKNIIFSNLDILSYPDQQSLFKSISISSAKEFVSEEMLAKCSAFSKNAYNSDLRSQNNVFSRSSYQDNFSDDEYDESNPFFLSQGIKTSTYLVCNYSNKTTGTKEGWEWGEYPRWQWESQVQSCRGIFASNCLNLNGHWARDDIGLNAIGTMFVLDTNSKIEADFNRACYETNEKSKKRSERFYARYYVSDSKLSLNHTIWFRETPPENKYSLPFDRIISFGDSLTDNGNLHTATAGLAPGGGYYQGHFTNGFVWAEFFAKELGLDFYNWSVGASATKLGNIFDMFHSLPYTLQSELINFEAAIDEIGITQKEMSRSLFTILTGGNNFVQSVRNDPEDVSDDIIEFMQRLIDLGAKHIVVVNVPDLSAAPRFSDMTDPNNIAIQNSIIAMNNQLESKLNQLRRENRDVIFYPVDLFAITNEVIGNPNQYSIQNTNQKCYSGSVLAKYNPRNICTNPAQYLFWDDIHPSAAIHCQVSENAINAVLGTHNVSRIIQNSFQNKSVNQISTFNTSAQLSKNTNLEHCIYSFIN